MEYQSQKTIYETFLLNEACEQQLMQSYIEEAIGWTSGTMNREMLQSINEKFSETIKEKFKKIWEKIKEIFLKITNGIRNFLSSKQGFLERNKDIILQKKVTYTEEVEMYNYDEGIKRMGQTKLKYFEYEKVRDTINPKDYTNTVLHGYFGFNQFQCTKDDLLDVAKDYFRGGAEEKTFKAAQLNMTNMYNYCVDYKEKILKTLEGDKAVIDKSYDNIVNALGKLDSSANSNNESFLFNNKIYSNFLESFVFNEANDEEMTSGGGNPDPDETNDESKRKASDYLSSKKMEKGKDKQPEEGQLKNDLVKRDSKEYDAFNEKCGEYFDTANYIIQAKLAVAKEMYEKYFKIIKEHVKSYNGQAKDDEEGKTGKKTGTDYNNDLTPKAKEAIKNQEGITDVQIRFGAGNDDQSDPNKYFIRINYTKNGQNETSTQSVADNYASDVDKHRNNGLEYVPYSTTVAKENDIWKIKRTFQNTTTNKKVFKTLYIDPNKNDVSDESLYIDANKVGKKTS